MGLRVRKSIRIFPGVHLNLSKTGPSLSFGRSGASVNVNSKGRVRATVGAPGTGISYSEDIVRPASKGRKRKSEPAETAVAEPKAGKRGGKAVTRTRAAAKAVGEPGATTRQPSRPASGERGIMVASHNGWLSVIGYLALFLFALLLVKLMGH